MHPGANELYEGKETLEHLTPVERWRRSAFRNAGFSPQNAELLALSRAVVHDVLRALERGCSLELAFQIFL